MAQFHAITPFRAVAHLAASSSIIHIILHHSAPFRKIQHYLHHSLVSCTIRAIPHHPVPSCINLHHYASYHVISHHSTPFCTILPPSITNSHHVPPLFITRIIPHHSMASCTILCHLYMIRTILHQPLRKSNNESCYLLQFWVHRLFTFLSWAVFYSFESGRLLQFARAIFYSIRPGHLL